MEIAPIGHTGMQLPQATHFCWSICIDSLVNHKIPEIHKVFSPLRCAPVLVFQSFKYGIGARFLVETASAANRPASAFAPRFPAQMLCRIPRLTAGTISFAGGLSMSRSALAEKHPWTLPW